MSSTFPGAVPELPVHDIATAVAYYQRCLGFSVDWEDEELGLAGISRGACRMFLANEEYRKQRGTVGPTVIWLNLESTAAVDDGSGAAASVRRSAIIRP